MEEKLENIEETQKSAERQPETVEERPDGMEEKPENIEEKKEEIDKADDVGEEGDGDAKPEAVEAKPGIVGKKLDGKVSRKKTAAYVEVTAAFLLILLSLWLFLNTRGTRLLYVSVIVGRVSRYYWIILFVAVIVGVIGLVSLRSSRKGTQLK